MLAALVLGGAVVLGALPAGGLLQFDKHVPADLTLVAPGTRATVPNSPPVAIATAMVIDANVVAKAVDQTTTVSLAGRLRVGRTAGKRQLFIVSSDRGADVVRVFLNLPVDLGAMIPREKVAELRYHRVFLPPMHNRTLTVSLGSNGTDRIQVIHRVHDSPIEIAMDGRDIDVGIKGLAVRQGASREAMTKPASGFSYPLPVTVRTGDGTETSLWQGQRMRLQSDRLGGVVHLLVLASQVAKPTGHAVYVAEGADFSVQLLVVTEAQP